MLRASFSLALVSFLLLTSASAQEWQPLFDGLSFDGWVTQNGDPVEADAWEVRDGMLHLDRSKGKGGNLLTDRDYGDFELIFEWKVAPEANNGIKDRVAKFGKKTLGIEYQVIDDYGKPNLASNHKTASLYDIFDAKEHNHLRPADEFNRGRIVVRNNRIEHWLNGHLITEAHVGSEEWREHIAKSKFADVDGFGINHFGRIMITDHNDEVWYRNIFIRELGSSPSAAFVANAQTGCCCPTSTRAQTSTRRSRGLLRRLFR